MNWSIIHSLWKWEPSVITGEVLILGSYFLFISRRASSEKITKMQMGWFLSGMLIILFALVSPLDILGEEYLFSAHMIQHTLLGVIAPVLLIIGVPGWLVKKLASKLKITRVLRFLTRPIFAFLLFNTVFVGWHFKGFYELALHNDLVHVFEHLLFISLGVINWWPILSTTPSLQGLNYPGKTLYLFLDAIPCTVLGAIFSFASSPLYPTYAAAERIINISPMDDQQIAGLIMAMPVAMVYIIAFAIMFIKWLDSENPPFKQGI
jgi:cytochrome c oxidase assembly factor CtaG